jgi:hydroxylamine reductase (hybrid-cluster protein)
MKKILFLIAMAITTTFSYGQSIFDKLEDMDGVMSVVISKDAFEILSKFNFDNDKGGNEMTKVFKMIDDLDEFKTFSTDEQEIAVQMENMVKSEVKVKKLTELMRLKEDNSKVWIYVEKTAMKDMVSEVLMLVKGIDEKTNGMSKAMIISLSGSIDINKMSTLVDTLTNKN